MFLDRCTEEEKARLIFRLQNYYLCKDLDEGKNYLKIFNELYISAENLTYESIASKYFLGINTLKRYITRINELAKKLSKSN